MTKDISTSHKYFLAFLAFLIMPISGLAIDIYVPSLPAISQFFQIDTHFAQLTITTYTFGLGLTQLVAGSISDSFGRRYPYLLAMIIFISATFLIPFSHHINQLLFLRMVQGISVALTIVPIRSVVSDLFEGRELQKMMSYITIAWSIGPIIAPAIGGYLQHHFGWKSSFYALGGYSIILFSITVFFLPETTLFKHPFHIKHTIKRYSTMVLNKSFANGLLTDGLLYSLIILFTVIGPFYIQDTLGYSAVDYGHISLLLGFFWFLGNMINRFLIDSPFEAKVQIGLWGALIAGFGMLISAQRLHLAILFLSMLFTFGGVVFPNYFTRSVNFYRESSAGAGAIFSASVFFIGCLSSYLATWLPVNSLVPLVIAYVIITIINLSLFYCDKYHQIVTAIREE
ncbi:MAG: multidrug effflux MFS transporter [Gammaproteobacteria bacterium]|nr:multidrug effflux MFS transporter [Gammaproteobacteria bacterium]MCW5583565.1 multidrug effflux MFS transporter [Gammaproteobacteria bacterium]